MSEPNIIYLLPPCSDAGEGRLWCEDPMTCGDFEGPHHECVCAGKGQEPTKYVRADTLDQERQRREQAEGLLRDARVEMACRLPATEALEAFERLASQIGRIDKHFGEWDG